MRGLDTAAGRVVVDQGIAVVVEAQVNRSALGLDGRAALGRRDFERGIVVRLPSPGGIARHRMGAGGLPPTRFGENAWRTITI